MKMNFKNYKFWIKSDCLHFREEWDDEAWNQSYADFKEVQGKIVPQWKEGKSTEYLITDFALEFYQLANPDENDYWLQHLFDEKGKVRKG